MKPDGPTLFTPFSVRDVTFANRIVLTPMCQYSATDGHATRWHRSHHGRFSLFGLGGAVVESTGVSRSGRITPGCLGIYADSHVAGLAEIVAIYHDRSMPVGIQLSHSGRKGSAAAPLDGAQPLTEGAWQTVAPSALPLVPGWPTPEALDDGGIARIVDDFEAAARRAVAAGFDFIEIHGAHGYLIHSFFSPVSNRRDDRWGGDLARRMQFPLAVARRVRSIIPPSMPLFYRASAVDGVDGGVTIEDTVRLAAALKAEGVDLVDCSSGGIAGASGVSTTPPHPGYLAPFARAVRQEAVISTMAVGLIVTPQLAEEIVASGSADLVAMGRQLMIEPSFAYRAAVELGLEDPLSILPRQIGFFLQRRRIDERTT